jgi:transcriptional regulator with XRE-family HTH domain
MCWLGAVPPSEVRVLFGLRLKAFRQSAGFKTARSFAEALELDENRYTRYERGEVEPNLASICRICSVLAIEPNDLLGFSEAQSEPIGSAREAARIGSSKGKPGPSQTWRVASVLASLRSEHGNRFTSSGDDDALTSLRATIEIYGRLLTHDPGHVIAEILDAAALDGLERGRKAELASLIDAFMRGSATPGGT